MDTLDREAPKPELPSFSKNPNSSTISSHAGTYSMMERSNSPTSSVTSHSMSMGSIAQNPQREVSQEFIMQEQPIDLKETSRSNNTAAFNVEEKENQEMNAMSLPMQAP